MGNCLQTGKPLAGKPKAWFIPFKAFMDKRVDGR